MKEFKEFLFTKKNRYKFIRIDYNNLWELIYSLLLVEVFKYDIQIRALEFQSGLGRRQTCPVSTILDMYG